MTRSSDGARQIRMVVLFLLAGIGALFLGEIPIVERADRWLHDVLFPNAMIGPLESVVLADLARDVSALGGVIVLVAVSATAFLYALLHKETRAATFMAVVVIGASVLSIGLKVLIMRERPGLASPLILQTSYSFPSGHALLAAAVYPALALLWRRIEMHDAVSRFFFALAIIVSVAVALSRVVLGAHYPSDVVGGLVIGYCWTGICAALLMSDVTVAESKAAEQLSPPSKRAKNSD